MDWWLGQWIITKSIGDLVLGGDNKRPRPSSGEKVFLI